MSKSDFDLDELIARYRNLSMSREDQERQRRGFAFGNVNLEHPEVTRELVDTVANEMKKTKAP